MAHTTREPYDTLMTYEYTEGEKPETHAINFIDTAGIRRKARVSRGLEREGVVKSIAKVEKTDIVLFVIDGSEELSHQDMQLGGLLEKRAKSVIILVNKWDLSEDNSDEHRNEVRKMIFSYFPHLEFAPMVFVSGKTGYRAHQLFPLLIQVWKARNTHVANRALEQLLERAVKEHLPARGKGTRHPELLGLRQIGTAPPVFELFVKVKTSLHRSYLNFLEKKLRESFGFLGAPIIIKLTKVKR
jgi:GTP-binding protein